MVACSTMTPIEPGSSLRERQADRSSAGGWAITQSVPGARAMRVSSVASGVLVISAKATYDPSYTESFVVSANARMMQGTAGRVLVTCRSACQWHQSVCLYV